MSSHQIPPIAVRAFTEKFWHKMTKEELEQKLMDVILEDPELVDTTNISVQYTPKSKSEDGVIELIGSVKSEQDKRRVEEIAKVNTREEIEIKNSLKVKKVDTP